MKLRINFHEVYFSYNERDNTYNNASVYKLAVESLTNLSIFEQVCVDVPVLNDCGEQIGVQPQITEIPVQWVRDPQDLGVALVDFPTVNIEDKRVIKILASYQWTEAFQDYNDDFNNDYSNDLGSDYNDDYSDDYGYHNNEVRTFTYENTFEIYGYDLGNNFLTTLNRTPNPDFNIYFAVNTGEYSCDYGADYNYMYQTYSNAITIRKPFTDEIYFYDNTSSEYSKIKWYLTSYQEINTGCGFLPRYEPYTVISEQRNGKLCEPKEIVIGVGKYLNETITTKPLTVYDQDHESGCGCVCCSPTIQETFLCEFYENSKLVESNKKHFASIDTQIEKEDCVDCEDLKFSIEKNQRANAYIGYPLSNYYRDDVIAKPYLKDNLYFRFIDYMGNVREQAYLEITNLDNYNPFAFDFNFTIPEIGDYIVTTELHSVNYANKVIRICKDNEAIKSKHWFKWENVKDSCSDVLITNCSFDDVQVKVEKVVEIRNKEIRKYEFETYKTFTLNKLSEYVISNADDGIYKITVTRNGKEIYFIKAHYCNLQECIKNITEEILCKEPCNNKTKLDFTKINVILPLAYLFLSKVNSIEVQSSYFKTLDLIPLNELYTLKEMELRLRKACDNCKTGYLDCGCS